MAEVDKGRLSDDIFVMPRLKEKNGLQSLKAGRKKRQELRISKLSITRYSDITWRLLIHLNLFTAEWVRKQTLAVSERYTTDELKHLEDIILGAEDKSLT